MYEQQQKKYTKKIGRERNVNADIDLEIVKITKKTSKRGIFKNDRENNELLIADLQFNLTSCPNLNFILPLHIQA